MQPLSELNWARFNVELNT